MVTSFPQKKRWHRVAQNAISELYVGGVPTWTSRSLHDMHDPAEKADKHPKCPKKNAEKWVWFGLIPKVKVKNYVFFKARNPTAA